MIPTQQLIDKIPGGDCFKACVASVLEIPLESVPDFGTDHEGKWFLAFRQWLLERGMCAVTYDWKSTTPPQGMVGYCLVSVSSRHPDAKPPNILHSVVGRSSIAANGEMELVIVFDPNGHRRKSEWGYGDIHDVIWIVRVAGDGRNVNALAGIPDPAAFVARAKAIEEAASNAVPMMQMAWKQYGVGGMFECMDALRAALAKIGGGA